MTRIRMLFLASTLALLVACGGGGAKVETSSTTMGQELMDLNESYQKGIITEKEYQRAKEKIMKRYN